MVFLSACVFICTLHDRVTTINEVCAQDLTMVARRAVFHGFVLASLLMQMVPAW